MKKYFNIDVIAFLEREMKKNTVAYQSDFEVDKEVFMKNAANDKREDRTFLWMSRKHGTECLLEHNVFLCNSAEHIKWLYYADFEDIITYAVELTGVENNVVKGNVYSVNYNEHVKRVQRGSVEAYEDRVTCVYAMGEKLLCGFPDSFISVPEYEDELGEYKFFKKIPVNQDKLDYTLEKERQLRR